MPTSRALPPELRVETGTTPAPDDGPRCRILDATIARVALGQARQRKVLSLPDLDEALRGDALGDQMAPDRARAPHREGAVVGSLSDAVGVPLNREDEPVQGVERKSQGKLPDLLPRTRGQAVGVEFELDCRERDASRGRASGGRNSLAGGLEPDFFLPSGRKRGRGRELARDRLAGTMVGDSAAAVLDASTPNAAHASRMRRGRMRRIMALASRGEGPRREWRQPPGASGKRSGAGNGGLAWQAMRTRARINGPTPGSGAPSRSSCRD